MIEVRPHYATRRFIGGVSILALCIAAEAGAGPARDQLEATTGRLLEVIQSPAYDTQQLEERQTATRRVLDDLFDWPEMAKRALGPRWLDRTPAEQEEFVGLFASLLGWGYVSRVDTSDAERIEYADEIVEGDSAVVRTKIIPSNDDDISVDYRLALHNGQRRKVYDIVFEGVNLVRNYRAQFTRVLRRGSYEGLIARMREKVGGATPP